VRTCPDLAAVLAAVVVLLAGAVVGVDTVASLADALVVLVALETEAVSVRRCVPAAAAGLTLQSQPHE
jgi:predicted dinucleotide-utilizing enzyme